MGGFGSGRGHSLNGKNKTNSFRSIDIRRWYKDGLLEDGNSFLWKWKFNNNTIAFIQVLTEQDQISLLYHFRTNDRDWHIKKQTIKIKWSACNYGGSRSWFICPNSYCGRRVAILYGASSFTCRHCNNLAYSSQSETKYYLKIRRANKYRELLGWEIGTPSSQGLKPKGMHWCTFFKLVTKHNYHVRSTLIHLTNELDSIQKN